MNDIAIIILAAGQSVRLGQAKQLVKFGGDYLIVRQCKLALATTSKVYCVLGFQAEQISSKLADLPVYQVINEKWSQGMGKSIACAIQHLSNENTPLKAVMLLLGDQWQLTTAQLTAMINQWQRQSDKIFVASDPKSKLTGPPVIFPSAYFAELETLTGEAGAKTLINKNKKQVLHYALWQAFNDLDTPEQLLSMQESGLQK